LRITIASRTAQKLVSLIDFGFSERCYEVEKHIFYRASLFGCQWSKGQLIMSMVSKLVSQDY